MAKPSAEKIADQNDRTTALGLIGRAVEHYASAVVVFESIGDHSETWTPKGKVGPFAPDSAHHLLAMSIEVALKAFLRERGLSVFEIKTEHGHDLLGLLERAEKVGLAGLGEANDRAMLSLLNEQFLSREFEFTVTGMRTFVPFSLLCGVACRIFQQVLDAIQSSGNFLNSKAGAYLRRDLTSRKKAP